jgi:hypothetical protein
VLQGLARAVSAGLVPADEAAADRAVTLRAAWLWPRLPGSRGAALKDVLDDVAAQAGRYDRARAITLFGMLAENTRYLALHAPTGSVHQDITDADGVVYRYFPGHGYQFHPLANFAALNAAVGSGDAARTRRLADALVARGVGTGSGRLVWEYYFGFGGGRPPWTSGMAQAVAAQSLARAGALLGDASLVRTAGRAERAIPGRLLRTTSFGPWVRLYSFSSLVVLNAQLQTAISLADYADGSGDDAAAALASRLRSAAAAGLGSFDTGFWTRYALPSEMSTLEYHLYVVSLLRRLAIDDPRFAPAATRFAAYTKQPPAFQLGDSGGDGVLFWLSKPSRVAVRIGGETRSYSLGDGWHRASWPLGRRAGAYSVHLTGTGPAGNRAAVVALPAVRAALASPPARTPAAATPAVGPPSFLVGVGVDAPEQARAAAAAGFGAIRVVVPWQPGETEPPEDVVAALDAAPQGRLVVQLEYATVDAGLAPFAASLAAQVPRIGDLVVGSPGVETAEDYVATLGDVRDALADEGANVRVAGAVSDLASVKALGTALAASGRTAPIMDELAFRSAVLPDYAKLVAALGSAFDGTVQPGSALPVLWDGLATATKVPPGKAPLYDADAAAAAGAAERTQASAYAAALRLAACQPTVTGVLLDRLVDAPEVGGRDGLLYPDGAPKTSLAPLKPALAQARRGTLAVCPGLGTRVEATAIAFPERTAYPVGTRSWSLGVACSRDCLYLATLERASSGVPMLARRGSLAAGTKAATVVLPRLPVPAGSYRLAVRLVARVNPGPLTVERGPVVHVG